MSITVNMNMTLPVPTTTLGPEWATELNEALDVVDQHDHSAGKGVPVPTAGLNVDADLSANSNKVTDLKSTQYDSQTSAISGVAESNSVQMVQGDLWIINGNGVAVQVTSGTSVVAPSSSNTPAGIVLPYAGTTAPAGYLMADGTAVSRSTYGVLFGVVGTTYGIGDGSTTFNLPDMQGRVPMGAGSYTDPVSGALTRALNQTLGAAEHILSTAELATHNHGGGTHTHTVFSDNSIAGVTAPTNTTSAARARSSGDAQDYLMVSNSTAPTVGQTSSSGAIIVGNGSDAPHNNMQPSIGLNYIIKT